MNDENLGVDWGSDDPPFGDGREDDSDRYEHEVGKPPMEKEVALPRAVQNKKEMIYSFENNNEKLLALAIQEGKEKVVELIYNLVEKERRHQGIMKFQESFVKAKSEFLTFKKNKTAKMSGSGYDYADMVEVLRVTTKALTDNGLRMRMVSAEKQIPGYYTARCEIIGYGHVEFNEFTVPIEAKGGYTNGAQKAGTAATYANRYAAYGALGIFPSNEDTDGKSEGDAPAQKSTKRRTTFAPKTDEGKIPVDTDKPEVAGDPNTGSTKTTLNMLITHVDSNGNGDLTDAEVKKIRDVLDYIKDKKVLPDAETMQEARLIYKKWGQIQC